MLGGEGEEEDVWRGCGGREGGRRGEVVTLQPRLIINYIIDSGIMSLRTYI